MRSHLVGSARLLHPPGVAEVGRGQDRVVVAAGDREWCSANREAAASAEAKWCLLSLVRRGAQQAPVPHGSRIGAIVSARDVAVSPPPSSSRQSAPARTAALVAATSRISRSSWRRRARQPRRRRAAALPRTRWSAAECGGRARRRLTHRPGVTLLARRRRSHPCERLAALQEWLTGHEAFGRNSAPPVALRRLRLALCRRARCSPLVVATDSRRASASGRR